MGGQDNPSLMAYQAVVESLKAELAFKQRVLDLAKNRYLKSNNDYFKTRLEYHHACYELRNLEKETKSPKAV